MEINFSVPFLEWKVSEIPSVSFILRVGQYMLLPIIIKGFYYKQCDYISKIARISNNF